MKTSPKSHSDFMKPKPLSSIVTNYNGFRAILNKRLQGTCLEKYHSISVWFFTTALRVRSRTIRSGETMNYLWFRHCVLSCRLNCYVALICRLHHFWCGTKPRRNSFRVTRESEIITVWLAHISHVYSGLSAFKSCSRFK